MKKTVYTEKQKIEFLELAKEMGIARAKRELGYPTFPTAKTWAKQYGVELPLNELSQYSNDMKSFYSHEEKLYSCQLTLDRIVEVLTTNDDLSPDDLKKLGEAQKRVIETMNLIEGKATHINESRSTDSFDNNINAMIEEQERMNRMKELEDKNN